jgi:hypothetical protein
VVRREVSCNLVEAATDGVRERGIDSAAFRRLLMTAG